MKRSRENMPFTYFKRAFQNISNRHTHKGECNVFYDWHFNTVQQYHFLRKLYERVIFSVKNGLSQGKGFGPRGGGGCLRV